VAVRRATFDAQAVRTLSLRLPLVLFAVFTLFPIYWLARSSLMAEGALVRVPLQYAPLPPGLENYILAFGRIDLGRAVLNSALVSIGACVLSLALVLVAAYGMTRFRFRGRSLLLLLLVATQLIPQIMLLVPLFVVLGTLGLLDTLAGVTLAKTLGTLPFSAILLKQFLDQITPELDEAAMLDGCGRLQALILVIMPLLIPGLVAVTIFNFITVWNGLILPAVLLLSPENATLPVALVQLAASNSNSWGLQAAGGMLNLVPTLVLFGLIQRFLVGGLASGAVKG